MSTHTLTSHFCLAPLRPRGQGHGDSQGKLIQNPQGGMIAWESPRSNPCRYAVGVLFDCRSSMSYGILTIDLFKLVPAMIFTCASLQLGGCQSYYSQTPSADYYMQMYEQLGHEEYMRVFGPRIAYLKARSDQLAAADSYDPPPRRSSLPQLRSMTVTPAGGGSFYTSDASVPNSTRYYQKKGNTYYYSE